MEQVRGNTQVYTHRPVTWLKSGGFAPPGGGWVAVRLIDRLWDTVLVEATLCAEGPTREGPKKASLIKSLTNIQPMEENLWVDTSDEFLVKAKVMQHMILGDNILLRTCTDRASVVLSKEAVSVVGSALVGRDRTDP